MILAAIAAAIAAALAVATAAVRCRTRRARSRSGPSTRATGIALALGWLVPGPALAHGSVALGDFYTGMFHPVLHFEALLPLLALALWSGQLGDRRAWHLPLAFLAAALLGAAVGLAGIALWPGRAWLPLPMLVLGLLVAARVRLPTGLAIGLAVLFGIQQGHANAYSPEQPMDRPLLFLAGFGTGIGLVLFHIVTRVARHRAFWLQTAVRVAGSWIAATGLLVGVLEWAGKR